MKTKKLLFSLVGLLIVVALASYLFLFLSHKSTGTIIGIEDENDGLTIWVIHNKSDQDKEIVGKSEAELAETYKFSGTVYTIPWYVPGFITNQLKIGQEVKIYSDGTLKLSAPGQGDAYWVEILE